MLIVIAIILFILIAVLVASGKSKRLAGLKQQYGKALQGSNRKAAPDAGRAYYAALRNDKALTVYDEQAIANDLNTMH